jgi:hypothetical protein
MRACLPAPIAIESDPVLSNHYRIERDGRVHRIRTPRPRYPQGATCCVAPGVWFSMRHRYLVVGRGPRTLWHTRGELPRAPGSFDFTVLVGSRAVAFRYANELYLAPFGHPQRRIGASEVPLGFTKDGLYTYLWGRDLLLLRSDSGALKKTIARVAPDRYFVMNGALYFIARGVVMRAYGARVERLVTLHRLGFSPRSLPPRSLPPPGLLFEPAAPMLELEDSSRLVVVRPDGSVLASTALRARHTLGPPAPVVAAPDGSAVAYALTTVHMRRGQTLLTHGSETVYLLRANTDRPVALHRATVGLGACGMGGTLDWDGSWLLYSDGPQNLSAIDTTGAQRTVELGRLVKRLPGVKAGFEAYWSGATAPLVSG